MHRAANGERTAYFAKRRCHAGDRYPVDERGAEKG
jgi:hypothetical protein